MTKLCILMLLAVVGAVLATDSTDTYVPPEPPVTHPAPVTTTEIPKPTIPTKSTVPPTTPTDTPKPTSKPTEPPKPTSKPTEPPKPTTKPTEPTTKPTSPTPKPTEPTPKPTNPTKPTPAPEPPKPIDPEIGTWQVNYNNSNISCILVQLALQIKVPYNCTSNKTSIATLNLPKNATVTGNCGNDTQRILLQWVLDTNKTDSIALDFAKNATTKKYTLTDIKLSLYPDTKYFPNSNDSGVLNLAHKHYEFGTSLDKSYRCIKKQQMNLTDDDTEEGRGLIVVDHLQFQAFHNSSNQQFTSAEDCAPHDTPDVVPIAVGCALAALVLIVLAAYLIGRRRRQARGYLSMFTETKNESDYIPMKNLSCFK